LVKYRYIPNSPDGDLLMATFANATDFAGFSVHGRTPASPEAPRWRRLFDALLDSRQRQAQRDIDRVVSERQGLITDSLEREIGERMFSGDWNQIR
jgi:hypothetical protein